MTTARERSGKRRPGADVEPDATVRVWWDDDRSELVEIRLASLSLEERERGRRAMADIFEPDTLDWLACHAWLFLRRANPDLALADVRGLPVGSVELTSEAGPEGDSPEV